MVRLVLLVPCVALLTLSGCGGGGGGAVNSGNKLAIQVVWNTYAAAAILDAGQDYTASALAENDPGAKGVTYRLDGPGTLTVTPGSGFILESATYKAPSTVASQTTATLVATSKADPSASANFLITLNPALSFPAQTLPPMYVGKPYMAALKAMPGTGNLTFVLYFSNLPDGISLSREGVLNGTPTTVGPYKFEVQVQDQASRLNGVNQVFSGTVD